jgi:hypothetical protein
MAVQPDRCNPVLGLGILHHLAVWRRQIEDAKAPEKGFGCGHASPKPENW